MARENNEGHRQADAPQCFRCQPTHSTNTSTRHACTSCRWWRSSAKASPAPPSTPQTHVFNQQPGRHGLPAAALRPMGVVCGTHTLQCPSGQVSRRSCAARAHVPAVAAGRLPVRGGGCSEDRPARAQAALRSMDRKRRHPQCLRHICAGCIRTDAKQAPARPAACRPAGRLRGACWPIARLAPSCPPSHGSRSAPLPLCLRMFGLNIHALPPSLPLVATRRPCACRCGRIWPGFGCRPAGFRPGSQLWGAGAARCLWPPPARRAPFLQLTGR